MDASNDLHIDQIDQGTQLEPDAQLQDGDTTGPALVEDSLIDEVSIDGMCGVY